MHYLQVSCTRTHARRKGNVCLLVRDAEQLRKQLLQQQQGEWEEDHSSIVTVQYQYTGDIDQVIMLLLLALFHC